MKAGTIKERRLFNLRYVDNLCFCENYEITLEQVEQLQNALSNTVRLMKNGYTNKDISNIARHNLFSKIMMNSNLVFGENAHQLAYEPYKPYQGASGNCVYFLHIASKNWLKIGSTIDLYNRTKEYHQQQKEYRGYKVLAYIQTETLYEQLEKLLHKYFESKRIFTEVFEPQPVINWLEQLQHQFQGVST